MFNLVSNIQIGGQNIIREVKNSLSLNRRKQIIGISSAALGITIDWYFYNQDSALHKDFVSHKLSLSHEEDLLNAQLEKEKLLEAKKLKVSELLKKQQQYNELDGEYWSQLTKNIQLKNRKPIDFSKLPGTNSGIVSKVLSAPVEYHNKRPLNPTARFTCNQSCNFPHPQLGVLSEQLSEMKKNIASIKQEIESIDKTLEKLDQQMLYANESDEDLSQKIRDLSLEIQTASEEEKIEINKHIKLIEKVLSNRKEKLLQHNLKAKDLFGKNGKLFNIDSFSKYDLKSFFQTQLSLKSKRLLLQEVNDLIASKPSSEEKKQSLEAESKKNNEEIKNLREENFLLSTEIFEKTKQKHQKHANKSTLELQIQIIAHKYAKNKKMIQTLEEKNLSNQETIEQLNLHHNAIEKKKEKQKSLETEIQELEKSVQSMKKRIEDCITLERTQLNKEEALYSSLSDDDEKQLSEAKIQAYKERLDKLSTLQDALK